MLIRITPEQIANNWDFLKTCIVQDTPMQKMNPHQDANILTALLMDTMQCWVDVKQFTENNKPKTEIRAVVITQIITDELSEIDSLLIYSLYGLNSAFDFTSWKKGILTLVQFGKRVGCTRIMAYTGNESVLTFVNRLGADTSQRVLILPFD